MSTTPRRVPRREEISSGQIRGWARVLDAIGVLKGRAEKGKCVRCGVGEAEALGLCEPCLQDGAGGLVGALLRNRR